MKRGQGAMEFLITYGWAILVVIIVLSSLYYLGIFNPKTSNSCKLDPPFVCKDIQIKENGVVVVIGSKNIQSGIVSSIIVNGNVCDIVDGTLNDNQVNTIECTGISVDEGDKASVEINIDYTKKSGLIHSVVGTGNGQIEEGEIEYTGDITLDETTVLYLKFDDSDNPTIDESEYSNNGNVNDATWTSEGRVGGGYIFDGINDYIDIGDHDSLDLTKERFTISALVYMEEKPSNVYGMIAGKKENSGNYQGYGLQVNKSGSIYLSVIYDNSPLISTSIMAVSPLNLNTWYHVVGVREDNDPADWKLYLDGEEISNVWYTSPLVDYAVSDTAKFVIGAREDPTLYFKGKIDEVRVWNRVLSPEEIENLYNYYS